MYICSMSPRQRVVRRATRCMTMMLLRFNKAYRALFVHLVYILPGQDLFTQISNMFKLFMCEKHQIWFYCSFWEKISSADQLEFLFRFVSVILEQGLLFYYWWFKLCTWTWIRPNRWVSACWNVKHEGGKWPYFDVKCLESHIQESAGTGLLLLSVSLHTRLYFKVIILQSADIGDSQLCKS